MIPIDIHFSIVIFFKHSLLKIHLSTFQSQRHKNKHPCNTMTVEMQQHDKVPHSLLGFLGEELLHRSLLEVTDQDWQDIPSHTDNNMMSEFP